MRMMLMMMVFLTFNPNDVMYKSSKNVIILSPQIKYLPMTQEGQTDFFPPIFSQVLVHIEALNSVWLKNDHEPQRICLGLYVFALAGQERKTWRKLAQT